MKKLNLVLRKVMVMVMILIILSLSIISCTKSPEHIINETIEPEKVIATPGERCNITLTTANGTITAYNVKDCDISNLHMQIDSSIIIKEE